MALRSWFVLQLYKPMDYAVERFKNFLWPPAVFFVFLIISLFLGDGKQPFVDVFMALGILLSFGALWYQRGPPRQLPSKIFILWLITIAYYIVRAVFSDSAGHSVSAITRMIQAYLVYQLFYSLSSPRQVQKFAHGLLLVATIATGAAFVWLLLPPLIAWLPLMNLLFATYGHNHVADLLLMVIPLALFLFLEKPNKKTTVLLILFMAGMLFSFARGAWIVLAVFFFLSWFGLRRKKTRRPLVLVGAAAFVVVTLGTIFLSLGKNQAKPPGSLLIRQLFKPPLWQDLRFKYWKQAVLATRERPWFGSGPGTFYLESKRLQEAPLSYSWFAHSFPLQAVVELGLVGVAPLFFLLLYQGLIFIKYFKSADGPWQSLFWGLVLVFVYSWFEFNLDFLTIWLLFWATAGLLLGSIKETGGQAGRQWVIYLCLFVLALFYLSSLGSMVADSFLKNEDLALTLAPYNTDLALKYARNKPLPLWVMALHRHNSEVIAAQAEIQDSPDLYHEAIVWDRLNFDYRAGYLAALGRRGSWAKFTAALRDTGLVFLPEEASSRVDKINFSSALLISFYTPQTLEPLKNARRPQTAMAKFYYGLGLSVLPQDYRLTENLWLLSSLAAPEWSYFHLELASLRKELGNPIGAQTALEVCRRSEAARSNCDRFTVFSLPPVGSWTRLIQATPL